MGIFVGTLDSLVGPILKNGIELVVTESTSVGVALPSSSPSVGLEGAESVGLAFGGEVGETDCDDVFDQRQMLVKSNRLTTRRFDMVELINGSSSTKAGRTSKRYYWSYK